MKTLPSFRRLIQLGGAATGLVVSALSARGDVVFAWNELLLQLTATEPTFAAPHVHARAFAMMHAAIHDALAGVAVVPDSGEQLAADRAASITAAHAVLVTLLPQARPSIDALEERHLATIAAGPAKSRGTASGHLAAARLLQARQNDGWPTLALADPPYVPLPNFSEQSASILVAGKALPPSPWLELKPFTLKSAHQFRVTEMRTFLRTGETVLNPRVASSRLFDAVDRTAAADALEGCWAQRPVALWNRIARELAAAHPTGVREQARLLALLNVALADATLSSLHSRHVVGSWRSLRTETWHPLEQTALETARSAPPLANSEIEHGARVEIHHVLIPPTPNFPAPAATLAGAAQAALTAFFGTDDIAFTVPLPPQRRASDQAVPRSFRAISQAARESAFVASLDARVSRESCVAGYLLGHDVGRYVAERRFAARR